MGRNVAYFAMILNYYALAMINNFPNDLQMIADIVKSTKKPTSVIAFACWTPYKKKLLMTLLIKMDKPTALSFIDNRWLWKEPTETEKLLIVADLNCPETNAFLEMANNMKKFAFPYRWLLIGNPFDENENSVTSPISVFRILPDSDVMVAYQKYCNAFIFTMIYKVNVYDTWRLEPFGNWSIENGLMKSRLADITTSTRRINFYQQPINTSIVILHNETKTELLNLTDILVDTVSKSSYRSIEPIYTYLNATPQLIFSNSWGYNRNGTYTGLTADLTVGDAELGGTILILTHDRLNVMDFLFSPTPIYLRFVFREPPLSYQNNLFLLPFKTTVWYCLGAFVLIVGVILYINVLWDTQKIEECTTDPSAVKPSLSDIYLLMITAISQQGSTIELKGTVGRIVMFLLFLVFLLLFSSYSASIVALLQSSSKQIRTLSDLLNSKLQMGVEDSPYNRYFFSIETEPIRKAVYDKKIAPKGAKPNFFSLEDGIKKMQTEPFAYHMNKGVGYLLVEKFFQEDEKCGLQEIPYFFDANIFITCRKRTPYKEIFRVGFYRIKEHGLCDREYRLIFASKPKCLSRGGNFISVSMIDFYPVLLMYLYGIILAFFLLFVEIVIYKKGSSKTNHINVTTDMLAI
ncbi:hypothetical protein ACJJTC_004083 [Scirpophaga incertulas]